LDIPQVVFKKDKIINAEIWAKYKFGTPVKGYAKVSFIDQSNNELFSDNFRVDSKMKRTYNIEDDLNIAFIAGRELLINVTVEFTDDSSKGIRTINKQLKILPDMRYEISLDNPHSLKPGFHHKVIATVRDPYGHIITNSGSNYVKLNTKFIKSKGSAVDELKSGKIQNSVAEFSLSVPDNVVRIEIKATYLTSSVSTKISKDGSSTPSLRVFIKNQ
jgi:hypothetical protein